jgi:hypothetical protein
MLDVLDIIAAIGELIASWRFYVCFAVAAAAIVGLYAWLPESTLRLVVSILAGVLGLAAGILWERRAS